MASFQRVWHRHENRATTESFHEPYLIPVQTLRNFSSHPHGLPLWRRIFRNQQPRFRKEQHPGHSLSQHCLSSQWICQTISPLPVRATKKQHYRLVVSPIPPRLKSWNGKVTKYLHRNVVCGIYRERKSRGGEWEGAGPTTGEGREACARCGANKVCLSASQCLPRS